MYSMKTVHATLGAVLAVAIPALAATGSAQAADKPVIRYVYKTDSTWWPPEINKLIKAEAEKLGVDYQVVGPAGGDIAKQVEMIENYVSQKVNVLVVSSLGPATCQAIDDAVSAGIKVVMADGDCPDSKRLAYYGSDNVSLGADTAKLFAEAVKGKGHQKILVITGTPGAANLQEREKGFKDKVKELGLDAEFLPTIPTYEDTQKSIDAIESSLRAGSRTVRLPHCDKPRIKRSRGLRSNRRASRRRRPHQCLLPNGKPVVSPKPSRIYCRVVAEYVRRDLSSVDLERCCSKGVSPHC